MSNYVFGTSLSYIDYLQAKSFETSVKSEISKRTRAIIASNEEIHQSNMTVVQDLSTEVEQLLLNVQTGLSELNATVQWGFSELLAAVGRVNESLAELVKTAKTPEKTWAFEQFGDAREALRKNLHAEALECISRAINGFSIHPGYKLEYRFHYLLGIVRMGSFHNTSADVVDLAKAEDAYLTAAKYAQSDHPEEASRAFLAAGWTAYCQGKMSEATQHTQQALRLNPDWAEGQFQLAKIQVHAGDVMNGLQSLKRAIEIDRGYSLKAASDDDFRRYDDKLRELMDSLRRDARERAESRLATLTKQAAEADARCVGGYALATYGDLGPVKRAIADASSAIRHDTYFGYLDAILRCGRGADELRRSATRFVAGASADARKQIGEIEGRISAVRSGGSKIGPWMSVGVLGTIIFFMVGFVQCTGVWEANNRQASIRRQAASAALAQLRRKGYNPNRISVQQADAVLGYRLEDLPPGDTGKSALGRWFQYAVPGSGILIVISLAGYKLQKSRALSHLASRKIQLSNKLSDLQKFSNNPPRQG
jgi:tetratricopeptide (TPR) repeat protein